MKLRLIASVLLTGLTLVACTDSEYSASLSSYAASAAQAGLTGSFDVKSLASDGETHVWGSAQVDETSLGHLRVTFTANGESNPESKALILISVAGMLYLEEAESDGNFTLTQIVPSAPNDFSKGFSFLELSFSDAFKKSKNVKTLSAGSGFLDTPKYVADNSSLSAERLLANMIPEKPAENIVFARK